MLVGYLPTDGGTAPALEGQSKTTLGDASVTHANARILLPDASMSL